MRDQVVYPHTPDSYVGSEFDGNGAGVSFAEKSKAPKSNDNMPSISDAYKPVQKTLVRHWEHR